MSGTHRTMDVSRIHVKLWLPQFLFPDLIHQRPKLVNILKAAVHAGEADVGYFIKAFEFAHDEFADSAALDFSGGAGEEFFFDALDGAVYLLSADGAFAQS